MANTNIIASPYIVSGETTITENVYKDDGSNDMVKGGLYYLEAGTMVPVETTQGSAQKLENDVAPFTAVKRYFISMADKTADGGFVTVTEIDESTLEGFVVDATGTTVELAQTAVGSLYEGYIGTDGKWAINAATAKGMFEILDVDSVYQPYRHADGDNMDEDSGGVRHGRVKFKIAKAYLA